MQQPILHKLLFQILQCFHHLGLLRCGNTQKPDLPKAFAKKQAELIRFVRPAQQFGSKFRDHYSDLVTTFLTTSVDYLIQHYLDRINSLNSEITSNLTSVVELELYAHIALTLAQKNRT